MKDANKIQQLITEVLNNFPKANYIEDCKSMRLLEQVLALLSCETCGGEGNIGGSGYEDKEGNYVEPEIVPCPDCLPCPDPEGCKHFKDVMKANERIGELEDLLGELYDEASYLRAGEWVIENEDLQKRVIQALKP